MDITKWLESCTSLPQQPPNLSEQLGLPPFLHSKEDTKHTMPHGRRKRKRSLADSSLLEARQQSKQPSSSEAGIGDKDGGSGSSGASDGPDRQSDSDTSSHRYARRPRRKTRVDPDEPKTKPAKERGSHVHRKGKSESKRARRRPRARGREKAAGPVHSFHAKNVPKDRLTLKPREKLGIFNKGRASSPVRGRGLPDLVFSEMKFLQKNRQPKDDCEQAEDSKKRHKKNHAQTKEQEISAFFAPTRTPLAKRDGNVPGSATLSRDIGFVQTSECEPQDAPREDHPIPTIELRGQPSLDVRNRGPGHDSASYFSWSDSRPPESRTSSRHQAVTSVDTGQRDLTFNNLETQDASTSTSLKSTSFQQRQSRRNADDDKGQSALSSLQSASNRCSAQPSLPPLSHSSRAMTRPERCDTRQSRRKLMVSISTSALKEAKIGTVQQQPHIHSSSCKASSEPSSEDPRSRIQTLPHKCRETVSPGCNTEPQTSSSLTKLLRECDSVFASKENEGRSSHMQGSRQKELVSETEATKGEPVSHDVEQVQRASGFIQSHRPRLPVLDGPRIYEQQARRVNFVQEPRIHYERREWQDELDEGIEAPYAENVFLVNDDHDMSSAHNSAGSVDFGANGEVAGEEFTATEEQHARASIRQRDERAPTVFWRPHRLY